MLRALVSLTLLLLVASPATAQSLPKSGLPPPPNERVVMRLDYTGVAGCSDAESFSLALVPLVHGWDPLAPGGRWRLVAAIKRDALGYPATAELYDPKGNLEWSRSIPAKVTCRDAVEVLTVVLAFHIDPPGGLRLSPPALAPAPPPPVCAPAPVAPECPTLPPPASPRWEAEPAREPDPGPPDVLVPPDPLPGLGFRLGASVLPEQYATGQFSLGFAVDAGLRWRFFSAAVEAHGDPPLGPSPSTPFPLSHGRVTGGLLACLHHDVLLLCGIGEAGRILFPVAPAPSTARSYGGVGVRAGFELLAGDPRFRILLMGEILAPINRASVMFEAHTLYQTAGVNGGLVIGLVFAP